MLKPANGLLWLVSLWLLSCGPQSGRNADATGNTRLVDSAYSLLYNDKDTMAALHFFDSAFTQAGDPTTETRAARFGLLANYHYFFTSDNKATARMIDSVLALYKIANLQDRYPQEYVTYLLFGGEIAYRLTQYSKANEYYFEAKRLTDSRLNSCERKSFNYSIAMVLYQQQNYSASLRYFKEAYALQATCVPQTTDNVLQQQEIQSNMGLCYYRLKKWDSALVHFDKAVQIADANKDSLGPRFMDEIYGVIYGNRAKVALAQNRLDDAEQLAKKSIALNYRPGYEVEDAMNVKLQLAEVYSRKKNFGAMFELLHSLEDTIQRAKPTLHLEWHRLMAAYYEQTAQPNLALQYFKSYALHVDSITTTQKQLAAADVAWQLAKKEQELQITTLKKDKQLALISLRVTVVISCMALAIVYLLYQNYRRSKRNLAISLKLNEEIKRQKAAREKEAKQRHKEITEAVIQAQESERSLIGLELHDNINQVLTTVKLHNEMVLEGIGDPNVLLPRASRYLQSCIDEIRSLSKRLSAPTLGKISLEDSVKDLIDSINLTSKVKITRELSGLENQRLEQDLHLGVYRILQEQLNNVVKHADASEVLVQLERTNGKIRLAITDNGKGFVVAGTKSGIGLMNMQTRAENLNGTFKLQSKPGKGCKVEVVVPCAS